MPKYIFILCLVLLGYSNEVEAQFGFSHEVGAITGPVAFQSDYGERHDLSTNAGNTGLGIGIIHYLNFSYKAECNCYTPETYFNDHFKLRSELSYNKTELKHFGRWADKDSPTGEKLRAMRGSTAVTNVGMQLEFFPLSIRDFTATIGSLAPFVSLGGQFCFYDPEAYSTMGSLDSSIASYPKYFGAFTNSGGTVWSVVSSVGTRYKLTPLSDLMLDLRVQYYFSNWVDGLNPDPTVYKENKANDWNVWLNFGYIYYLQ
ncbi:glutamate dehydrogenase [Flavobacterium sp. GT3R68]|uniref:THC0290_0291 family protein n=1 Tax=Flavobacterium sp. GT3R68 TaxID=2594437 RepID=UPI000F89585C|nr:glutamate dehydrogenase [Flavobacterium sp. GT3R68]RTY95801.1 glutamate dehydrogenase [Flavobacterium sp. GSN2]TRW93573.1 glutamate dehydrogenase [Flavobacterium sp. GT3R68]